MKKKKKDSIILREWKTREEKCNFCRIIYVVREESSSPSHRKSWVDIRWKAPVPSVYHHGII